MMQKSVEVRLLEKVVEKPSLLMEIVEQYHPACAGQSVEVVTQCWCGRADGHCRRVTVPAQMAGLPTQEYAAPMDDFMGAFDESFDEDFDEDFDYDADEVDDEDFDA